MEAGIDTRQKLLEHWDEQFVRVIGRGPSSPRCTRISSKVPSVKQLSGLRLMQKATKAAHRSSSLNVRIWGRWYL